MIWGEGNGEEMIGEEKKETVVGMYYIREQSIVNIKGANINLFHKSPQNIMRMKKDIIIQYS